MPKLRTIIFVIVLFFLFSHFYGETFKQSGVVATLEEMKNDITDIIEHPNVSAFFDSIKQEIEILWNDTKKDNSDDQTSPPPSPPTLSEPTSQTFSIYNIEIGDTRKVVEEKIGKPNRSTKNEYGVHWNTYHEDYHNFMMIAYDQDNKVVGMYTNQDLLSSKLGITFASSRDEILAKLEEPIEAIRKGNVLYKVQNNDEYDVFLIENNYITMFYDVHENNTLTAIQIISADLEKQKKGHFGVPDVDLQEGFEYQLFDLTNATRVNHGLPILSWEEPLRKTARDHSMDMAENNYFSHDNLEGKSPYDRMADDAISFRTAGENLAAGQSSSIFAHEGLMNSLGHRENILQTAFESLAVGVAFNDEDQPYFTENFITK